jgi:DNA-binding transcriptional ArsR family regulator
MTMKKKPHFVESIAQLNALAAPARQEICDCLSVAGPSTVSELAEHLGRPADAMYFHLKRLLKAGLVIEVDQEKSGRHVSTRYDVVGRPLKLSYRKSNQKQVKKVIGAATRAGLRDFEHAYAELGEQQVEGRRDLWAGRAKGWLSKQDIAEVNRHLEAILEVLLRSKPGSGETTRRRLYALTFLLSPVAPPFRERKEK